MEQDDKTSKIAASPKTIALYTLLTTAIFELLAEKGILSNEQVTERMKKIEANMVDEIAAHQNILLIEAIFELLTEKGILTGDQVMERVKKIKAETTRRPTWVQ